MANIKSQIKRNKQNEKARQRNKAVKSSLKTAARGFREAAERYANVRSCKPGHQISQITAALGEAVRWAQAYAKGRVSSLRRARRPETAEA